MDFQEKDGGDLEFFSGIMGEVEGRATPEGLEMISRELAKMGIGKDEPEENINAVSKSLISYNDKETRFGILRYICGIGNVDVLNFILGYPEFQQNMNSEGKYLEGGTLLENSVGSMENDPQTREKHLGVIMYLMASPHYKDVGYVNEHNETILHCAVRANALDAFKILEKDVRIDKHIRNNDISRKKNMIELAYEHRKDHFVQYYIQEYGIETTKRFFADQVCWQHFLKSNQWFLKQNNIVV